MPRQMVYTHGKLVPIHSHQGDTSHENEPNAQMQNAQQEPPKEEKKIFIDQSNPGIESLKKAFKL